MWIIRKRGEEAFFLQKLRGRKTCRCERQNISYWKIVRHKIFSQRKQSYKLSFPDESPLMIKCFLCNILLFKIGLEDIRFTDYIENCTHEEQLATSISWKGTPKHWPTRKRHIYLLFEWKKPTVEKLKHIISWEN